MANYKRKRPRTKAGTRGSRGYWLRHWPRWWDIQFHTRPKRRAEARAIHQIKAGDDPEGVAWPLGNHKPHTYYW